MKILDRENEADFLMWVEIYVQFLSLLALAEKYFRRNRRDLKAMRRKRAEYYERAWRRAADKAGATVDSLGNSFFRIRKGTSKVLVFEQYTQFVDRVTERLIADKSVANQLLEELGVPTPKSILLPKFDLEKAKNFLEEVGGPVVVKPSAGTGGGDGVTTNVRDIRRLIQALAWSRAYSSQTIIEEQVRGANYRLLFFDGEMLDCIERRPPCVTGDGNSSVRELVHKENNLRLQSAVPLAQDLILIDPDLKNTLAIQGLTTRSVPDRGEVVQVKEVINCNRAEENESPIKPPAESILRMGREIAEAFGGVRLIGIDIITDDLSKDLKETGGLVIEINTPPGHFYHHMRKKDPFPVAEFLLPHFFSSQ